MSKVQYDDNIDLPAKFDKKDSLEVYQIRQLFQKLIQVMKFALEAYNSGDDAVALLNYAQARTLYYELGNLNGVGICENNIGNIHLRNSRYAEAIAAYRTAISVIQNELAEFQEANEQGWGGGETLAERLNALTRKLKQQVEEKILSPEELQKKTIARDNEKKKKTLILANRMFHLAQAFMLESINTTNQSWQSAIDNFEVTLDYYKVVGLHPHKIILINIELCNIYLRIGKTQKASNSLDRAESSLIDSAHDSMEIPKSILNSKIKIYKGLIAKEFGQIPTALELFSQAIVNLIVVENILNLFNRNQESYMIHLIGRGH